MGQNAPHYKLEKLPPLREKVETIEILRQTNKSTAALAELKGIARTIPNQGMLINAVVLQEAKDSSEIENIITTQDELYKALTVNKSHISPATKEVVDYRKAIFHGFELAKRQGFLRVNDIVDIQQVLVDNTAGIRRTPGTVLKNDTTGEIVYTPPQDKAEILDLLTNFINHFNQQDDLSPLINMAILHYQFESIHPFYDGNGRTGRIINILYLIKERLQSLPVLYLSNYIIKHKTDYYRLLQQVREEESWEEWIMFMIKGVEQTSRETIDLIIKIKELMQVFKNRLRTNYKFYSQDLLNNLFKHPYTKIEFLVNDLGISRLTAANYLNKLAEDNLLTKVKLGTGNYYINQELFDLLSDR